MEKQKEDRNQSSDKLEELRKLIEGCQFGLDEPIRRLGNLRQEFMELKVAIASVQKGEIKDNPANSEQRANALAQEVALLIPEIKNWMTAVSDRLNVFLSGQD